MTDFFLSYLTTPAEFMEAARHFIFETYCRLHSKIDLRVLAAKLHMDEEVRCRTERAARRRGEC